MDKLYNEVNVIWLTYLRCALEIYRGNLVGFCDISDEPSARKKELESDMKDYLMFILERFTDDDLTINKSSMEVAIEYCISIEAVDFLFGDVLIFFEDRDC